MWVGVVIKKKKMLTLKFLRSFTHSYSSVFFWYPLRSWPWDFRQSLASVVPDVMLVSSSRRRHTRCYRDCSSDVCSSDLRKCGNVLGRYHLLFPGRIAGGGPD